MKWLWPNTLRSQIILILFTGVALVLLASAAIHLHDRSQALSAFGGQQTAQRLASIIQLLDPLSPQERERVAAIVTTPLQYIRFMATPPTQTGESSHNSHEAQVKALLQRYLGQQRPLQVTVMGVQETDETEVETATEPQTEAPPFRRGPPPHMGRDWRGFPGPPPFVMEARWMRHNHQRHQVMMNRIFPQGISFLAQVELADGSWVEFHNLLPRKMFTWPKHLLYSMVLLFAVVTSLSLLAVRLTTRPLSLLADAARGLGQDLNRPPLPLTGPREVRHAAQAFNTMQARLVRYVQERTQLLAAISHDLKTPMTRMRLRVENLKNEPTREELLKNLTEMENMTRAALDYIRGMEGMEPLQRVDVASMLERLEEEFQEMGAQVTLQCAEIPPFPLMPDSFKRCLANLISNGISYGEQVAITARMVQDRLHITLIDQGEGIVESEMERVFEPFVRLEKSRNRHTGGTGLGLSIARNIARAHGGELTLKNHPEGGLEVLLVLPKGKEEKG
ncbi:MAG: HAMP domain-containing protein [Magnetococcales bacterium]|nr:HAMP domain-containing protein [Magnetococcales bacterium]